MFETLSDRIRHDEGPPARPGAQILHWVVVVAVAIVLFGGLYLVVQHLEG